MKGIEVRFPVGRDECAAWFYRPREHGGDAQWRGGRQQRVFTESDVPHRRTADTAQ
jgi:hypothetical protein